MYDGYLFFCNDTSQKQCLSKKRYSCMGEQAKPAEVKEGSLIFLYNPDVKSLLGPFTTLSEGDELDAGAWIEQVDEHIPSEDIKVTWEDLHIIDNAPDKLPFIKDLKTCKLTTLQTQRILDLLKEGRLYLNAENQ